MVIDDAKYERLISAIPYAMDQWTQFVADGPRQPALSDSNGTHLSRAELDNRINRVNGYLRSQGIGREDVVAITLSRGANPVIAAYGVWKAGAAFCLVESNYAPDPLPSLLPIVAPS